jgi:hypothetical protein
MQLLPENFRRRVAELRLGYRIRFAFLVHPKGLTRITQIITDFHRAVLSGGWTFARIREIRVSFC